MLLAANWKMNKTGKEAAEFFRAFARSLPDSEVPTALLAPFTALPALRIECDNTKRTQLSYGAQNFYFAESGAFTGEISADMLIEHGCTHVICGHSERRQIFGESDDLVGQKVVRAIEKNLIPIFCIGETLSERESGNLEIVLTRQIDKGLSRLTNDQFAQVVVAYEPVWAIGTGVVATPEQAEQAHTFVRTRLKAMIGEAANKLPILYGGSVTPANVYSLMVRKNIDGALVGGASLKVDSLLALHTECVKAAKEK
jgi:triosephosphate isomerase (TIM)